MKKGVEVHARVYLEGEADAPADFAAIGKRVVAEALRLGGEQLKGYTLTVRSLRVDDDPPEGEDASRPAPDGPTELVGGPASKPGATLAAGTPFPPARASAAPAADAKRTNQWQFWRK